MRFNPFRQIHQGLRALLYDTALCIQHTHFENPDEMAFTLEKTALVLQLFHGHAGIEDSRLIPLIAHHEPDLAASFENEHEQDEVLGNTLESAMEKCRKSVETDACKQAGEELQRAFDEFTAFNLRHMNREETLLNEVLWKLHTDEELIALVQEIAAGIPPEKNQHYSLWMLRGNNNAGVAQWLSQVKISAPPSLYDNLYSLAAAGLGRERLKEILRIMNQPETATV